MKTYRVVVNNSFATNMNEIINHLMINSQTTEGIDNFLASLDEALASLKALPLRCNLSTDDVLREMGFRVLHIKNYDIFFDVLEKERMVRVMYIKHVKQDILSIKGAIKGHQR